MSRADPRVEVMLRELRRRGIDDPRLLAAMERVPRERFVPERRRSSAYDDSALPIAQGQTISQPYMVARTIALARVEPGDRVLDVGAGSGYQCAVLAALGAEVIGIERIPALATAAALRLEALGYANVEIVVGDGSVGWPEGAPYDAIVVAAAAPRVPKPLAEQLAVGGRLVLPVGGRHLQRLTVVERRARERFVETEHDPCVYVPLVGEEGFD